MESSSIRTTFFDEDRPPSGRKERRGQSATRDLKSLATVVRPPGEGPARRSAACQGKTWTNPQPESMRSTRRVRACRPQLHRRHPGRTPVLTEGERAVLAGLAKARLLVPESLPAWSCLYLTPFAAEGPRPRWIVHACGWDSFTSPWRSVRRRRASSRGSKTPRCSPDDGSGISDSRRAPRHPVRGSA